MRFFGIYRCFSPLFEFLRCFTFDVFWEWLFGWFLGCFSWLFFSFFLFLIFSEIFHFCHTLEFYFDFSSCRDVFLCFFHFYFLFFSGQYLVFFVLLLRCMTISIFVVFHLFMIIFHYFSVFEVLLFVIHWCLFWFFYILFLIIFHGFEVIFSGHFFYTDLSHSRRIGRFWPISGFEGGYPILSPSSGHFGRFSCFSMWVLRSCGTHFCCDLYSVNFVYMHGRAFLTHSEIMEIGMKIEFWPPLSFYIYDHFEVILRGHFGVFWGVLTVLWNQAFRGHYLNNKCIWDVERMGRCTC